MKSGLHIDYQWMTLSEYGETDLKGDPEDQLIARTADNLKELFCNLAQLYLHAKIQRESKPEELQIHDFDRPQYEVLLPGSKTMFPRAKRVPEAKEPTKWEKFSKDKGIVKRKRSRMVLDEVSGQFVPRWGARSIKKLKSKREGIREVGQGVQDVFEDQGRKKRMQKDRQQLRQFKNKGIS